jgi:hypothetical protein
VLICWISQSAVQYVRAPLVTERPPDGTTNPASAGGQSRNFLILAVWTLSGSLTARSPHPRRHAPPLPPRRTRAAGRGRPGDRRHRRLRPATLGRCTQDSRRPARRITNTVRASERRQLIRTRADRALTCALWLTSAGHGAYVTGPVLAGYRVARGAAARRRRFRSAGRWRSWPGRAKSGCHRAEAILTARHAVCSVRQQEVARSPGRQK